MFRPGTWLADEEFTLRCYVEELYAQFLRDHYIFMDQRRSGALKIFCKKNSPLILSFSLQ